MIPLSLILWLMTQGQSPAKPCPWYEGTGNGASYQYSFVSAGMDCKPGPYHGVVTSPAAEKPKVTKHALAPATQAGGSTTCYGRTDIGCAHPAPAEHIIEIRTRTEEKPVIRGNYLIGCDGGFKLIQSQCVRVTRELYIDGIKFGIIKETEAK